jgi:magnesium-transporting ATPase (P-type)
LFCDCSIAAPITAKTPTPRAVILVLLEGRTSLVTTYVLVHYNIMTAMIVLFFTCILYG